MDITIMCPNLACRSLLRVPEKVRGKKVRCGECGTVFCVPDGSKETDKKSGKKTSQGN